MEHYTMKLKEIADCNLRDKNVESPIRLPDIQRGLVWKPKQIELLWDSIISEYPIGSLMIINNELFDGQQRVNAITKGFDKLLLDSVSPESILWIDLDFAKTESRYYGFRMTTKSHPWGYNSDGGVLSVAERRDAINKAKVDEHLRKSDWDIRCFRPYGAKCPIPFTFVTEALYGMQATDGPNEFAHAVAKKYDAYSTRYPNEDKLDALNIEERCSALYGVMSKLREYKVFVCKINIDNTDLQKLELFFNRVNTGGTVITQEELAYSAIKLYWNKQDIARINRELSEKYMPEERFAQIVFRAYCPNTGQHEDRIRAEITAQYIRKLREEAKADNFTSKAVVDEILSAYANNGYILRRLRDRIDKWIVGDVLPSYIRTEIAYNEPTLYVFLFILARYMEENRQVVLSPEYLRALTLYIYCCSNDCNGVIQYLYKNICSRVKNENIVDESYVTHLLWDCILERSLEVLHPCINEFTGFRIEALTQNWDIGQYYDAPYGRYICRIFNYNPKGRHMMLLKVAEREAYEKFFSDYDPARRDLWEDSNRPWDDDHIVPKDWISHSGQWKKCCNNIVWSIGNFAQIPFEINRGKGNRNDWSFYEKDNHAELLHFDPRIKELTAESLADEEHIRLLAELTIRRFCNIYREFVELLRPLGLELGTNRALIARKQIMCALRNTIAGFENARFYYVANDAKGKEICFDAEDDFGWMQQWIAVGVKNEAEDGLDCVAVGYYPDSDKYIVETGIRKNPDKDFSDMEKKEWWILCNDEHCKEIDIQNMDELYNNVISWIINESYWSNASVNM